MIFGLVTILFSLIITYNHLQQPTENDVFNITDKWSTSTEEVFLIKKIDGNWFTIFRNQHSVTIAELQQNWLGVWKFRNNATLSSTEYPPILENQITWSASGKTKENAAYYFGMVTDPGIVKITIETQDGISENVQFIKYEGIRFFFKRADGPLVLPVNISGFSKSGELIYSSLRKIALLDNGNSY